MSLDPNLKSSLKGVGFGEVIKVADTLQGIILKAVQQPSNQRVAIKMANKYLHKNAVAYCNGKYYNVKENILMEATILKYLSEQQDVPRSLVRYSTLLECANNYYLVMADGGTGLLDFVQQAHALISAGHLNINEWHKVVQVIFSQMLDCISFIHSRRVCHFDISLENVLINDVEISCIRRGDIEYITFNLDDIRIKVIDFGLATIFSENDDFVSNKFCGKNGYKSPEILAKKAFNAQKNDTWCLGICLWVMVFGFAPWSKAVESDPLFVTVVNGYLADVLKSWNIRDVTPHLMDLLQSFCQYEDQRIGLQAIKKHEWLN
eukprot:545185_1